MSSPPTTIPLGPLIDHYMTSGVHVSALVPLGLANDLRELVSARNVCPADRISMVIRNSPLDEHGVPDLAMIADAVEAEIVANRHILTGLFTP